MSAVGYHSPNHELNEIEELRVEWRVSWWNWIKVWIKSERGSWGRKRRDSISLALFIPLAVSSTSAYKYRWRARLPIRGAELLYFTSSSLPVDSFRSFISSWKFNNILNTKRLTSTWCSLQCYKASAINLF